MKKILFIALILLGLEKVDALPVGNPSEASLFSQESSARSDRIRFGFGFYGDYVFNRNLETKTGKKIDYSQISTNAGYLVVNFWETVDLFAALGATQFAFNTSLAPFNSTNRSPRFDFTSLTTFSWSLGARATLWQYKRLALGLEGQYFSANPSPKVLFIRTNVDDYPDSSRKRTYSEWQIGTGISYRYNPYFVPYVAVKYSRAFWNFDNQTFLVTGTQATLPSFRNSKNWGYAVGATLAPILAKKFALTVEGRFADETAVYVNGQIRF